MTDKTNDVLKVKIVLKSGIELEFAAGRFEYREFCKDLDKYLAGIVHQTANYRILFIEGYRIVASEIAAHFAVDFTTGTLVK